MNKNYQHKRFLVEIYKVDGNFLFEEVLFDLSPSSFKKVSALITKFKA